jgi:hypothetical protein
MRTYQQLLFITTSGRSVRDRATGWTFECGNVDASKVQHNTGIDVGKISSHPFTMAKPMTIAHALRLGWRVLSRNDSDGKYSDVEWILCREVDSDGNLPS